MTSIARKGSRNLGGKKNHAPVVLLEKVLQSRGSSRNEFKQSGRRDADRKSEERVAVGKQECSDGIIVLSLSTYSCFAFKLAPSSVSCRLRAAPGSRFPSKRIQSLRSNFCIRTKSTLRMSSDSQRTSCKPRVSGLLSTKIYFSL
jgi:hypothetical protein